MSTNWKKKKEGLRWGIGIGITYLIFQILFEGNIFNGKNTFMEDVGLVIIFVLSSIFLVFIFYWLQKKSKL